MTIQSEYSPDQYSGNGSTTVFAYTFKITDDDNVKVIVSEIADDTNQQTLTKTTHYTVSGVDSDTGGNITLLDLTSTDVGQEFLPSTWRITISSIAPAKQLTDLANQGPFHAETIEDAFDYQMRLIQQNKQAITLAPKTTETSGDTGDELMAEIRAAVVSTAADAVDTAADVVSTASDASDASDSADAAAASAASINLPSLGSAEEILRVNSGETGYESVNIGQTFVDNELSAKNASGVTIDDNDTNDVVTLDLGTVTAGDRVNVFASMESVSTSTATSQNAVIEKSSGAATISFLEDASRISNSCYTSANGDDILVSVAGKMKVTGSGTLVVKLRSYNESSGCTVSAGDGQIYAEFTKKQ